MLTSNTSNNSRSARGNARRRGGPRSNNNNNNNNSNENNDGGSDVETHRNRQVRFANTPNHQNANGGSSRGARGGGSSSTTSIRGGASARGKSSNGGAVPGGSKGNSTTQAQAPSGSGNGSRPSQQSFEDRFQVLYKLRPKEKEEAIANGTYQDPEKPVKLSDAITIVGTCQDMCPEYERVRRVRERDVWAEEATEETRALPASRRLPVEPKMVKKFARAAAGMEEQLPSDLRPPHILKLTLDYLITDVIGNSPSLGAHHHFVWDRSRCIRNDFSIQQVSKAPDVTLAIHCFERILRFHILSLHVLRSSRPPYQEYSSQQEFEQLDKTNLSLNQYYADHATNLQSPNEAEFRSYSILFAMSRLTAWSSLQSQVETWSSTVRMSPAFASASRLYQAGLAFAEQAAASHTSIDSHRAVQETWRSFWQMISSNDIPYLQACVAETAFAILRFKALQSICRMTKRSARAGSTPEWNLSDLAQLLGFSLEEEIREFIESYGLQIVNNNAGVPLVDFVAVRGGIQDALKNKYQGSSALVEQKRDSRSYVFVIDDRASVGFDGQNDSDSLFVPDHNQPSVPQQTAMAPGFNPGAAQFTPASQAPNNVWQPSNGIHFGGTQLNAVGFGSTANPQQQDQRSLFERMSGGQGFGSSPPQQSNTTAAPVPQANEAASAEQLQIAENAAKQQAADAVKAERERQAAEEAAQRQAEEAAARMAQEKQRLTQEAEQARLAEQAARERAAQDAQRIREAQAREEAERQRQIHAQIEAQQAAQKRRELRDTTLNNLAETVVTQEDGFLHQFLEVLCQPMIEKAQKAHAEQKRNQQLAVIREKVLMRKFGMKWQTRWWHRRLAREGKARRQRMRDAALRRSILQNQQDLKTAEVGASSFVSRGSQTTEHPLTNGATKPLSVSMPPPPRPNVSTSRTQPLPPQHSASLNSNPTRPEQTKPPQNPFRRTNRLVRGVPVFDVDKTDSNYFKLLKMGIQPNPNTIRRAEDASVYREHSHKRSREDFAGSDSRGPVSVSSVTSTPDPEDSRPSKRQVQEGNLSTSLNSSSTSSDFLAMSTEDLIAESNKVLTTMAETEDWFRDQQEVMSRNSARTSRRPSMSGSMSPFADGGVDLGHAVGKAFDAQSVASMDSRASHRLSAEPPKYRSRVSKFLPRDQFADARLYQSRYGEIPSYARSSHTPEQAPKKWRRDDEQSSPPQQAEAAAAVIPQPTLSSAVDLQKTEQQASDAATKGKLTFSNLTAPAVSASAAQHIAMPAITQQISAQQPIFGSSIKPGGFGSSQPMDATFSNKQPSSGDALGQSSGFGSLASTTAVTAAAQTFSSFAPTNSANPVQMNSKNLFTSSPNAGSSFGASGGAKPPTSESVPSASSSFGHPGIFKGPTMGSSFGQESNGSKHADFTQAGLAVQENTTRTQTPEIAAKAVSSPVSETGTQRHKRLIQNGSKAGATQISPPSLKRKAHEQVESQPIARKTQRKAPPPPSNLNRFALLSEENDDSGSGAEEADEANGVSHDEDDGQETSVGFSEADDGEEHGGQGNDYGTEEDETGADEDEGSEEFDSDDFSEEDGSEDEDDAADVPADPPKMNGQGGTSVEDAISLD